MAVVDLDVKIRGKAEARRALHKVIRGLGKASVQAAALAGAREIEDAVRPLVPVDRGDLRANLRTELEGGGQ